MEWAGAFVDLGTLVPFVVAYISVLKMDPKSIITIPIRDITAPPNWPKPGTSHNESTAAANWLKTTWLT